MNKYRFAANGLGVTISLAVLLLLCSAVVRKNSVQRFRRNVTLLHSNRLTSDASFFGFL
jgi:hypothetical protein